MIKKISGLLLLRAITLVLLLLFNFMLLKYLTIDEVGVYYLIATVSYLGNAVIFVGSDLYLQNLIAGDIQFGCINKRSFIEFLCKTSLLGGGVVFVFSWLFFLFFDVGYAERIIVCTLLTTATYVTGLFRNLYHVAGKAFISSAIQLIDAGLKLLAVCLCVFLHKYIAIFLIFSYLILSLVLLMLLLAILLITHVDVQSKSYFKSYAALSKQIFPIGASGLFNWLQLQSYRPYLSVVQHNYLALGVISFLTNLGSSATNATMTVISQLFMPRVYATKGRITRLYLLVIASFGMAGALISLPCGWIFLSLANKQEMMPWLYLIPVGVLQETINSMIGVLTVHYMVTVKQLRIFPVCTLIGAVLMLFLLLVSQVFMLPAIPLIAAGLVISQLFVFVVVFMKTNWS